ncbi:MAG: B12-binding domain-containing radical SAM protein [Promethearchaeota archaeon]|jgi:radical SAM superfamily enzyme YgiQ (UPF0313 family)
MKILLLNASPLKKLGVIGQMYPPLGLLYLASYARKQYPHSVRSKKLKVKSLDNKISNYSNDIEIKIVDGYQEKYGTVLEKILEFHPDVLGVSFTTQAATGAYEIINRIKAEIRGKDIFVVCGGAHSTVLPEEVLQRSKTDMVVLGEGEVTFYEIIKEVEAGSHDFSNILGVAYKNNDIITTAPKRPLIKDLDSIPFPARDLIDLSIYPGLYYKKEREETYMTSSRGCPHSCVYCSNPVWKHNKPWYRLRSPQNVVDEIEYIVNELGIKEIYDQTDEFNGNMKWAKALCDEIIKRGIKVSLKAQMRSDHMDRELAEKMKAAGFWLGLFGVESGNNQTLKGVNKRVTTDDNSRALAILKNAGIKTFALLMAFNVWEEDGELCFEDKDDSKNTLENIKKLIKEKKVDLMSWSLTTPYPGSKLYDIAIKHKLIPEDLIGRWEMWDSSERMVMKLPGITEKDWIEIHNKGKKLQIFLLLKSGTFNLKSLPLYIKRGISQITKYFKGRGI